MHSAEVGLVVGTRPEAIKMAPVARALAARGLSPCILLTDQQRIEPDQFLLGGFPALRLGCPGMPDPDRHVRAVQSAALPAMPDTGLLLVQGDTSSAMGAALAAVAAGVPVGHVEAGLRTFDPQLPWPEEKYRRAIDSCSDLLFAPTELSACNLRAERVAGEIHVTGNSGIDALHDAVAALPPPVLKDCGVRSLLVTCHRRESWGEGLKSIAEALVRISADATVRIDLVVHPNRHVGDAIRRLLGGMSGIRLIAPVTHRELVARMRGADLILSDSGGIQEEAPALGTPLLVLRDKTERPEGIASGNMRLVGTTTERIVAEVQGLLSDPVALAAMSRRAFPYGDGRAAPRIAAIVEDWLVRRGHRRATNVRALSGQPVRW